MSKPLNLEELQNWPFKLGAPFRLVAKELLNRGWSITLFESNNDRRWGYFLASKGDKHQIIASLKSELYTTLNSRLGYLITTNKMRSYEYAQQFGLKVPKTKYILTNQSVDYEDVKSWSDIVVKPLNGSSGKGITVGVTDDEALQTAIQRARQIDQHILLQEKITGSDFRLLFIDYQLFAAIRREPAFVLGDGEHTVVELIDQKNSLPKPDDFKGTTSLLSVTEAEQAFGVDYINQRPKKGEKVAVTTKANISLGGEAHDVTELVNPEYIKLLRPLIKSLGLRICGVDIMTVDISQPPLVTDARLIELNSAPNIRPHLYPTQGISRNAAINIVDMLEDAA